MIEIKRIFDNFFYPLETNESNFFSGVNDHIYKMEGNNPSLYAPLIAAAKAARNIMIAAIQARGNESTEQQGSTILMNKSREDFLKFIRIREGLVKSTFEGVDSPQYQEFFPEGLSELSNVTLFQLENFMEPMVNKATKYQAELGAQFLTDCMAKRQTFVDARTAQLVNKGETDGLQNAAQAAIMQMAYQLCINLHTIALDNIGNPGEAAKYFEQAYFQRTEQSGMYTGTNAPGQTKTVRSQGWTNGKNIRLTNKGTSAFVTGFANADGVPIGDGPLHQSIPAGEVREFTAIQMGYAPGNAYLNITADDSGASWEVFVTD